MMFRQTIIFIVTAALVSQILCHQGEVFKTCQTKPQLREMIEIGNDTFYFGVTDGLEWYYAEAACELQGMQLITLDDEVKWLLIQDFILDNPEYDMWYWTSGHRDADADVWLWSTTQSNITFSVWMAGQPSREVSEESCMNFAVWAGGWDDDSCAGISLNYICEMPRPAAGC